MDYPRKIKTLKCDLSVFDATNTDKQRRTINLSSTNIVCALLIIYIVDLRRVPCLAYEFMYLSYFRIQNVQCVTPLRFDFTLLKQEHC